MGQSPSNHEGKSTALLSQSSSSSGMPGARPSSAPTVSVKNTEQVDTVTAGILTLLDSTAILTNLMLCTALLVRTVIKIDNTSDHQPYLKVVIPMMIAACLLTGGDIIRRCRPRCCPSCPCCSCCTCCDLQQPTSITKTQPPLQQPSQAPPSTSTCNRVWSTFERVQVASACVLLTVHITLWTCGQYPNDTTILVLLTSFIILYAVPLLVWVCILYLLCGLLAAGLAFFWVSLEDCCCSRCDNYLLQRDDPSTRV